jgi:hypothetical protein
MRNSYYPGGGNVANNGQTYNDYGSLGYYGHPIGVLGRSNVPPAYTMTKDFRREEKRGLREAKREAKRERKLARKTGTASYLPHSNLPPDDSYNPYRDSRSSYPAGGYLSDDEYLRSSRHSHQPYSGHIHHSTYWDPVGAKGISIEPCPCTDPNFPCGPAPVMAAPVMAAPVMGSPIRQSYAPVFDKRPVFDETIYYPVYQSRIGRSSYLPVTDEHLLPASRVGGHYGLIAPATNPYQPLYSPTNVIDWRKTAGL